MAKSWTLPRFEASLLTLKQKKAYSLAELYILNTRKERLPDFLLLYLGTGPTAF